jgi:hypothetical protein
MSFSFIETLDPGKVIFSFLYLHEITAVSLAELTGVGGGVGSGPDGVVLATVVVLGLDNLVDGLVLANGVE